MSQLCGCCVIPVPEIPIEPDNRPGLSAIAYRLGTFASFRHDILRQIAATPELAALRTRSSDDYTITVAELWSVVANVLTFYQERIANESFIRTSVMRDSVLRLVRMLGYELRPGVAATTLLAFTLEPGKRVLIPAELRVQSVPGDGETPQKFETLEPLAADARLNRLRMAGRPVVAAPLSVGRERELFAPGAPALATAMALAPTDRVVVYTTSGGSFTELLQVEKLEPQGDQLAVRWVEPPAHDFSLAANANPISNAGAFKLGRIFRLFAYNAPLAHVKAVQSTLDPSVWKLESDTTPFTLAGGGGNATTLFLDAKYDDLKPGALLLVVGNGAGANAFRLVKVDTVKQERGTRGPVSEVTTKVTVSTLTGASPVLTSVISGTNGAAEAVIYELIGAPLRFWPFDYPARVSGTELYLPGRRVGWSEIELGRAIDKGKLTPGVVLNVGDFETGRQLLLVDASGAPVPAIVTGATLVGSDVRISGTDDDRETIELIGFGPADAQPMTALVSAAVPGPIPLPARRELLVTIGGLPPQTIALPDALGASPTRVAVGGALEAAIRAALPGAPSFAKARVLGTSTSYIIVPGVPGDALSFGPTVSDPDTVIALGLDASRVRFINGVLSRPFVPPPAGLDGDVEISHGLVSEVWSYFMPIPPAITVTDLATETASAVGAAEVDAENRILLLPRLPLHETQEFLRLTIQPSVPFALDAASAVLLGNVAPASHGETVRAEILGDGDAARAFQRFTLKKKPVTHLSATTASGVRSSLRLFVNGVRWREVDTLYGAGERDEIFTTRIADDATFTAQCGDGKSGSRLPSGRDNVVVSYRQGIGVAGRVRAASLTTLLDRPNGLKSVINPTAADGGADPESMAHARTAAPGTVRSFGRAVSLRDFEDVAVASGEVAKASAGWVWAGHQRVVHLTVAAQRGATFSADGLDRIRARLLAQRDPNHRVLVDNFVRVPIRVDASLTVHENHLTADVLAAARAALLRTLSFEALAFGQAVHLSDVYAILQNVAGVVAVDIDELSFKSTDSTFLTAHGATSAKPQPSLRVLRAYPDTGGSGAVFAAEQAWIEVPSQDVRLTASGGLVL